MTQYYITPNESQITPEDLQLNLHNVLTQPAYTSSETHEDILTLPNGFNIYAAVKEYRALGFHTVPHHVNTNEWLKQDQVSQGDDGQLYFADYPIVLATLHGSKLYGMDHAHSDEDRHLILQNSADGRDPHSKQSKRGDDDKMIISLKNYLNLISNGVPQALETRYSPFLYIGDSAYKNMLINITPNATSMAQKYRSASKALFMSDIGVKEKGVKHSIRLLADYGDYVKYRKIQPHKSKKQREIIERIAHNITLAYK